jgi:hypothetical protein
LGERVEAQPVAPKSSTVVSSKIASFFDAVAEKTAPAPTVDLSNY